VRSLIETVAWLRVEEGRVLCTRSRGQDVFWIPGGKREPGESELDTLLREVKEELAVDLAQETIRPAGTYQAGNVLMSCYTADYQGTLTASSEIEELRWLRYTDRDLVAPVDQLLFDDLRAARRLYDASVHGLS
jgi:8-oxo-dGTP diphosphatase